LYDDAARPPYRLKRAASPFYWLLATVFLSVGGV
jgi:hypothetical protein